MDPFKPLLIGNGRLAKHLTHYLLLKGIPHLHWPNAREFDFHFDALLAEASCVWILVSDQGIPSVYTAVAKRARAAALSYFHSSAAFSDPRLTTLHPLQTFGPELYSLEAYQAMIFTLIREEQNRGQVQKNLLLAALGNQTQLISEDDRTLYHAYCSMIANFPQILWSAIFSEMKNHGHFNADTFLPLLSQSVSNFLSLGPSALTGPLVRGDQATVKKHLVALNSGPFSDLYQNFVELYSTFSKGQK